MRVLLGSGGMSTDERRERWKAAFDRFLGDIRSFVFVPYAADLSQQDRYLEFMREMHPEHEVLSTHESDDPIALVARADALYMGGGNSFLLLRDLQQRGLLDPIRRRVVDGMPYIGVSAGSNMACPTMCTTNDMPIVMPADLNALGIVPFQINPHYFAGRAFMEVDGDHIAYGGETGDEENISMLCFIHDLVNGLWEGGWLLVEGNEAKIDGGAARLFIKGEDAADLEPGASVSHLLLTSPG